MINKWKENRNRSVIPFVKRAGVLILFYFLSFNAFGESAVMQLYMQRFTIADLPAKAQILENAANDRAMEDSIGLFYEFALRFALDNTPILRNDHNLIRIIDIAVRGLQNTTHTDSLGLLWDLFLEYRDFSIGAEILITIGKLGRGNEFVIDKINNLLAEKIAMFNAGQNVNYAMISACISAIMELGDISSYPVLFELLSSGFPEIISFEAQGVLDLIPGDLNQFLLDIIKYNPPAEKFVAFRTGINSHRLSISEKGQLAELALEQALVQDEDGDGTENADLAAMRYAAVLALTDLGWTRASPLAIRNYYRVQADFTQNIAPKSRFIEAIALLGAVGGSDAALILGMQLSLINSRMERNSEFDEEITLAIVQALGNIGDRSAFHHLLDVSNLPYPENIQFAAREAIARLRW